jgi:putative flippase GtrA
MINVMNQAARFSAVGLLATIVHIAVAILLVEFARIPVFWANIGAFAVAVLVSYFGNHHWTFACSGAHARYLPRFISIAALGLAIGQVIVWAITESGGNYRVAVVTVALMVPAFSFVASRLFVFAEPRDEMEGMSG